MKAAIARQSPGLLVAALVYAAGFVVGISMPEVTGGAKAMPVRETESFLYFVSHNAPLLLVAAVGAITGGLLTVGMLLFNGALVGAGLAGAEGAGALSGALAAVLPHASFEVPAILLAATVGLAPVSVVARLALGRVVYVRAEVRDAVLLLGASLALVVLGAVVETWVTPLAIHWTTGGR